MTPFTVIIAFTLLFMSLTSAKRLETYDHEAHIIMRRMAEMDRSSGFEDHDVAKVHLPDDQGQRKLRLAKRDLRAIGNPVDNEGVHTFQLDLSTGSTVDLALNPSNIVDSDTIVSYLTANGSVVRRRGVEDCYSYGQVNDSSGGGWAALSRCNGLFGFAQSHDYEYFFHPIEEARRSKRDANEEYDVHVLWRRLRRQTRQSLSDLLLPQGSILSPTESAPRPEGSDSDRLNATGIVIEMAMFSDAHYWQRLQLFYPGREDDFLLARLAGTQALFSDREKMGYDVKIKLKLLEYWIVDPEEYTFTEDFSNNLQLSCDYTVQKYSFDLHAVNTGITDWNDGRIGLAYTSAACTQHRCLVTNGVDLNTFVGFAHEVGHTLGMNHLDITHCPEELTQIGGFMGGGVPLNFSPCMKYQLAQFLTTSKSNCLFKEAYQTETPIEYNDLPSVFPGQVKTPDGLCQILAGVGYRFGPHERPYGTAICKWFICLNEDKISPEFGRAQKFTAPMGFPCGNDSFCEKDKSCRLWSSSPMANHFENLRSKTPVPTWSEWSTKVSQCSRSCGTGVRTRRRTCQVKGFNITPQCQGMLVKPELCNTKPCPGEPTTTTELRQLRGNEVCSRFLKDNVHLKLKGADVYYPTSDEVNIGEMGPNFGFVHSASCLLKCTRNPPTFKGDLDAIMPDGTLCLNNKRSWYELTRFNIDMRCIRGLCLELSDCPDPLKTKDKCGICGGDSSRCVNLVFDSLSSVPRKQRAFLAIIPAGSTNIDVYVNRLKNTGTVLELWSNDNRTIIGNGGQYPRNNDYDDVPFAGTKWLYTRQVAYLRASGPLQEPVVIQALRLAAPPIEKISISYAMPV